MDVSYLYFDEENVILHTELIQQYTELVEYSSDRSNDYVIKSQHL